MKLYRGLKQSDFVSYSPSLQAQTWKEWEKLLQRRIKGDLAYPHDMNSEILALEKMQHLTYQHFSDDKETALAYAKREQGVVVEVDVPLVDIKKYFMLEFQNFSKRKKRFELVYIVRGTDLHRHSKQWGLKTRQP